MPKTKHWIDGVRRSHPEIESRAISQAGTFNPAVTAFHLSIPAVLCIMRHLMPQMLAEP
jgi:hypothetical protein